MFPRSVPVPPVARTPILRILTPRPVNPTAEEIAGYGPSPEKPQEDFEVVFAAKAFPATAVMSLFAHEGLGCDVASAGELHLALRAGFDPAQHGDELNEQTAKQSKRWSGGRRLHRV